MRNFPDHSGIMTDIFNFSNEYLESALDAKADSNSPKLTISKCKSISGKISAHNKKHRYSNNCQLTTGCFEMQVRGIDMLPRGVWTPADIVFQHDSYWKFINNPQKTTFKKDSTKEDVIKIVQRAGDGSRFYMVVGWKGRTSGHVFNIVNIGDSVIIVDCTANKVVPANDDKFYLDESNVDYTRAYIIRTDNKTVNRSTMKYNDDKYAIQWKDGDEKYLESIVTEACKDLATARQFVREVGKLAKKYDANYFIVTDGASGMSNKGNPAVKNARDAHIEWEKKHDSDPYEDWSLKIYDKDLAKVLYPLNKKLTSYEYAMVYNNKPTQGTTDNDWYTKYHYMSPAEVDKYRCGTCWDLANYQYIFLTGKGFKCKNYYIEFDDNSTHSITIVFHDNRCYYIESSFKVIAGMYAFDTVDDVLNFVMYAMFRYNQEKSLSKNRYVVYEYGNFSKYGIGCQEFMDAMKGNRLYKKGRYTIQEKHGKVDLLTESVRDGGVIEDAHDLYTYLSKNFEYGCPKNGKVYDYEGYEFFQNYKVTSPEQFKRCGGGVCWDYVGFESSWFLKHSGRYTYETYYIEMNNKESATHTFLIYREKDDPHWYYFEVSWQSHRGIFKAKSKESLIQFVVHNMTKRYSGDYEVYKYNHGPSLYGKNTIDFMNTVVKTGTEIQVKSTKPSGVERINLATETVSEETVSDQLDGMLPLLMPGC